MTEPKTPKPPAAGPVAPASGDTPDSDETQIFTPDEARMAEHLDAQIAANKAAHEAAQDAARKTRERLLEDEGLTARPISPEAAARLAAQSPPVPAAPAHDDRTIVRPSSADPADDPMSVTQRYIREPAADAVPTGAAGAAAAGLAAIPSAMAGGRAVPGDLPAANKDPSTLPHSTARAGTGTADPQMRQVGRYLVKSRLGRGGMATVYRAHDPSIGRDVAIKFLHASLSEDDECRMRFLREARAAGGLSHPNIVVVHDVGEIENRPYMAMELVDGAPLSEALDKQRTLPIRDVVVMGLQLARALEYAHARGIVHRDIKPGNIMLLADAQTIKVSDFGIAHMDETGGEQRTMVGAVMGTPQYMSPEQTRGEKVDGRSDLFSAGIVLYQMLTGERPFKGESLVAVATKIANEDPPPLASKRRDVPAALRRVVDRCLAKQPSQRFQSGKELAAALSKVLTEQEEVEREKAQQRIMPLRVKWALMMSLIVAVVMGITAAIITQRQYAAMMGQVTDYGASMARFIAAQNAANVLGEDWDTVDVAVQEMMKTRNFERVSVMDAAGTVRVSSAPGLVGKPYHSESAEPPREAGAVAAPTRYVANGEDVLGFQAPVLFNDKLVGRVALGIPEKPLTQVARLSISLMVVLALVTVLAVAIAMYLVANWFAKPIRLVGESMAEIGKGRFDHRIHETRNDEFGVLFKAFDAMAQSLQARELERAPPSSPSSTPTSGPGTAVDTLLPSAHAAAVAAVSTNVSDTASPRSTGPDGAKT